MAKIKVLSPDVPKLNFVKEGVQFYSKRIQKFLKTELIFVKVKNKRGSIQERLKAEEEAFKKYITSQSYLIVLDERGKLWDTENFTKHLESLLSSQKELIFLVGGPEGVSKALKKDAKELFSLSPLTFNHELALLVLLETLYRSLSILKGHPYHRG